MARLSLALLLLALITAAPAAADTPAVTLAPLPGENACLTWPAENGCTSIKKELHDTLAFELSGDGRHAYLLSWGYGYPSSIHLFARDRFDGALTEKEICWSTEARDDCEVDPLLEDASDLTISPDWQYVYVIGTPTPEDGDDNSMAPPFGIPSAILVFARNAGSGELTRVQCLTTGDLPGCDPIGDLGEFARGPIVSPDGRHFYFGGALLDRDPATGRLSRYRCAYEPTPEDSCPNNVVRELSPDGRFGFALGEWITTYARDPSTGALTEVTCPDEQDCRPTAYRDFLGGSFSTLTVAPDGRNVYAASLGWGSYDAWVYDMDADPGTGLLSEQGCFHVGELDSACAPLRGVDQPGAVSAAPDGQAVYVPSASVERDNGGGIGMFARDPVTGRLTWAGCITRDGSGGMCVQDPALGSSGLAVVSPDSRNVYMVSSQLISVLGLAVDVRPEALRVSKRGRIRPRLICPTGVTRCEGKVAFKRRGRPLARKAFTIPGGQTTRIRVRLSKRGREQLQDKTRLRTNAKLTADAVPGRTVRAVKLSTRPGRGSR